MSKEKFEIETHDGSDKSFAILGPELGDTFISIDYDDVNHQDIDAISEVIVEILNKHWSTKETQELLKQKRIIHQTKRWNEDKHLREDYESLEDYLNQTIH